MNTFVNPKVLAGVSLAALALAFSCKESGAASRRADGESSSSGAASVAAHIDGNNFKIDTIVTDCKAGQECVGKVKLTAVGGYHINKEYPYKITMTADPGVEFLGKGDVKEIFSKPLGDFAAEEKEGTMSIRFRPKGSGELVLKGTYKMSVCSEQNCQLETKDITLELKQKK